MSAGGVDGLRGGVPQHHFADLDDHHDGQGHGGADQPLLDVEPDGLHHDLEDGQDGGQDQQDEGAAGRDDERLVGERVEGERRVLFFSIESKDERDSAFSLDTFSDKTFVITSSGSFILLVLSTVLGIFQVVMKTVSLDVQQALDRAALVPDDSDVTADTKDGVITLTGHVRTWAEHDAVVGAALMARGVIDISDELQVTG